LGNLSRTDHKPGRRITSHVGRTIVVAENEDISGGVIVELDNFMRYTFFAEADGAIGIEIAFSPDGGEHFVGLPEGPIVFTDASRTIIELGIDATHMEIVGDSTALVKAWIRGIY
jgi:hypothetical protein